MAKCPTCGKEFTPCRNVLPGEFSWKQHACSWECANDYIRKIQETRSTKDFHNWIKNNVSPQDNK